MSRWRNGLLLSALLVTNGCDTLGPSTHLEGKYELASIDGTSVPFRSLTTGIALHSQSLELKPDGIATSLLFFSTSGPVSPISQQGRLAMGNWVRRGSTVIVKLGGKTETFQIEEQGARLRTTAIRFDRPQFGMPPPSISLYTRQ
ncbi:MAG: hypothetical protein HOP28_18620 [Gemmatimonadales bacterium]|nr:hypothetical protein [Gemmatimonadales bacterium]